MDPLEGMRMEHFTQRSGELSEEPEELQAALEAASQLPALYCAWHSKVFGTQLLMRAAQPGMEAMPASHGICKECEAWLRGKAS